MLFGLVAIFTAIFIMQWPDSKQLEAPGTMKYIHQKCLEQWLIANTTDTCEICHSKYKIQQKIHKNIHCIFPSVSHIFFIMFLIGCIAICAFFIYMGVRIHDYNIICFYIITCTFCIIYLIMVILQVVSNMIFTGIVSILYNIRFNVKLFNKYQRHTIYIYICIFLFVLFRGRTSIEILHLAKNCELSQYLLRFGSCPSWLPSSPDSPQFAHPSPNISSRWPAAASLLA